MHRVRACEGHTAHGQTRGEMIQGRSQGKNKRAGRATASRGGDEHEATASCVRGEHEFEARERAVDCSTSACSRSLLVATSIRVHAVVQGLAECSSSLVVSSQVQREVQMLRRHCEERGVVLRLLLCWLLQPATAASPRSVSLLPWAAW